MKYGMRPPSGGASSSELPEAPLDVAIVGAGRVGCSIGRALLARGHRVVAATVASKDSAPRVLAALGPVPLVEPDDAGLAATVIVIAVPDDVLAETAVRVAKGMRESAVVMHTSGIAGTDVLAPCGENVAAVHPVQTVPEPTTEFSHVTFGVTAPAHLEDWTDWFVRELGGVPLPITEESRALYHAALAIASNFLVTIVADAAEVLGNTKLLAPLLRQTVENVIRIGGDEALTGPIVRGDSGTVRKHVAALAKHAPHLVEAYVANSRRTLERSIQAGRLGVDKARAVAEALEEALVR